MGIANLCDKDALQVGARCILCVGDSSRELWWGRVEEVHENDTYLSVSAVITGRFEMVPLLWTPVYNEGLNNSPSATYQVYPDTKTNRNLLYAQELMRAEVEKWKKATERERTNHLETMAYLVRNGVLPGEKVA